MLNKGYECLLEQGKSQDLSPQQRPLHCLHTVCTCAVLSLLDQISVYILFASLLSFFCYLPLAVCSSTTCTVDGLFSLVTFQDYELGDATEAIGRVRACGSPSLTLSPLTLCQHNVLLLSALFPHDTSLSARFTQYNPLLL